MLNQQDDKISSNLVKRKPKGRKTVTELLEGVDSQEIAELNKSVFGFTQIEHTTEADGNIFQDLGFSSEESEKLKAESQRLIEKKLGKNND